MGGTRIFEFGQRDSNAGGIEGGGNCCHRTFNWGKVAAGHASAVNGRKYKEIRHWLCSVLSHFVDFYINFTLRQWTGMVERARIIFFLTNTGGSRRGQGIGYRRQLSPLPRCWRRPCPLLCQISNSCSRVDTFSHPGVTTINSQH